MPSLTFTVFDISDATQKRKKERLPWQACLANHSGLMEDDGTSSDEQSYNEFKIFLFKNNNNLYYPKIKK